MSITALSGSRVRSSPTRRLPLPRSIHCQRWTVADLAPSGAPTTWPSMRQATTNAARMLPVPTRLTRLRGSRRPGERVERAPSSGKQQDQRRRARDGGAVVHSLISSEVVDVELAAEPEDLGDQRQADDDLGRGDDDDHEGEDLALLAVEEPAVGDEGDVDGVEHQLDAHEHDDRVAPDQHPERADAEQEGGQAEQEREGVVRRSSHLHLDALLLEARCGLRVSGRFAPWPARCRRRRRAGSGRRRRPPPPGAAAR